jgi:hypothetical protein
LTVINFQEALASAQTVSFEPLPNGDYDMVVVESTPTQSSTNKPMIKVKYRVETGPNTGKTVFNNYTFSTDSAVALAIFFRHMSFHGLDANFFAGNPAWEQVASTLQGRRVRLELGTKIYQGSPRNEVLNVKPPDAQAAGQVPAAAPGPQAPVMAPPAIQPPSFPQQAAPAISPVMAPAPAPMPAAPPMPAPTMAPAPPPQGPVGPPPAPAPVEAPAPAPVPEAPAVPAPPAAPPGWAFVNGQWVPDAAPAPAPTAPPAAPEGPVAPPVQQFEQSYPAPPPVPT